MKSVFFIFLIKKRFLDMISTDQYCFKSVRIRSFSGPYFPVFSPNAGKYGPKNLRIRTLFTQCNSISWFFVTTNTYCIVTANTYCIVTANTYCIVTANTYCIVTTNTYCIVTTNTYCIVTTNTYCIVTANTYCIVTWPIDCNELRIINNVYFKITRVICMQNWVILRILSYTSVNYQLIKLVQTLWKLARNPWLADWISTWSKLILVENKITLKVNTLITPLLPFIQAVVLQCSAFVPDDLPM